jgi:hypothetical protein
VKVCNFDDVKFLFNFFFVVLGLELRAYTLSPSTSPVLCWIFLRWGLMDYFPGAGFEPAPDLCFMSSWDDRPELPTPSSLDDDDVRF